MTYVEIQDIGRVVLVFVQTISPILDPVRKVKIYQNVPIRGQNIDEKRGESSELFPVCIKEGDGIYESNPCNILALYSSQGTHVQHKDVL
jgi:hypothetical protein